MKQQVLANPQGTVTAMLSRLGLLVCLLASPAALGQTYPDRNVTIVVTSAAGALTVYRRDHVRASPMS